MVDSVVFGTDEEDVEVENPGIDVTLIKDKLPSQLKDLHDDLQQIITHIEVPEDLPEDQNWPHAEQAEEIAKVLMSPDGIGTHLQLRHRKIGFFYRSSLKDRGQPALGKGSKCGSKLRELSGYEFIVQINHEPYRHLPPHRKIRTIDHELCHLTLDEDENPDSRGHDIEEFTEIVRRWGLRDDKQVEFGETLKQTDLFEDQSESKTEDNEAVPA